ncbi:MAG: PLP-dependent aminotransferase family protein [Pyrinomonadaceae bacterium]
MEVITHHTLPLADWAEATKPSALQQALTSAARTDVISFALGLPAAELFPAAEFARAATRVLAEDPRALQYSPPLRSLKESVVELMALRGVTCRVEQVFLTAGAQQGMSLLARVLLNPGGCVVTDELTYTGFRQAIEPLRPEVVTVPADTRRGMDLRALENLLAGGLRPAFIYAMTEGHNPLGVSMSAADRLQLARLAAAYGVPVVEDDAYGFLSYDDACVPPARAFEERWVCYVGSFSKILAPALRAGWLVVPEELVPILSVAKEASDIDTATFSHHLVNAYLATGQMPEHINRLRRAYRTRRDIMLAALAKHFPAEACWCEPRAGVFVWVEVGRPVDTVRLLGVAVETERVAFLPGPAFVASQSHQSHPRAGAGCMRLNFSHCPPDQIEEGIARLARAVRAF